MKQRLLGATWLLLGYAWSKMILIGLKNYKQATVFCFFFFLFFLIMGAVGPFSGADTAL